MKIWLNILILSLLSLTVFAQICPSDPPTAVFVTQMDQTINHKWHELWRDDPELTFFKELMKYREEAILHTTEDAIAFFKEKYGIEFELSNGNQLNEYFWENAKMSPFMIPEENYFYTTMNTWIRTGSTRSTCYTVRDGGFQVTFLGNQTLHGTYGGVDGKSADIGDRLLYGFYSIDMCEQSPVIIQYQSASPLRKEPIDGKYIMDHHLYNRVLGHGKSLGVLVSTPDPDNAGQFKAVIRNSFTFPAP